MEEEYSPVVRQLQVEDNKLKKREIPTLQQSIDM
jgi:hypothetical protein